MAHTIKLSLQCFDEESSNEEPEFEIKDYVERNVSETKMYELQNALLSLVTHRLQEQIEKTKTDKE